MKKFTSLMLMLLFAVTTWGQSSLRVSEGLLATQENGQYKWTSEKITAPDGGFNKLRITFLQTSNNEKPAGFPCVAIAEFYLYDKDGNPVELTVEKFSSNATHSGEGSMSAICNGFTTKQDGEGDYDWYWHSQWSGTPSPYGYHYLEVDVTGIEADLSEYSIGWVTRRSEGSPKEIIISAGAESINAIENANSLMLPKTSTDIVKCYTIRSIRSKNYLTYSESNAKPVQESTATNNSYWYFTEGTDGKVCMNNLASGKVLGTNFEMTTEGEWYISPAVHYPGVVFSKTNVITNNNCIDDQNGSIGSWQHAAGDAEGTTWLVEEVDVNTSVLSLKGMKIAEIGEAAEEITTDQWYILQNYNRGAFVSQEDSNWKMRNTQSVAAGNSAEDKAGYLFKITKNGEYYNIMSGNGKYFKLGSNTASTSTSPVKLDIALIGSSTNNFYIFDVDNGFAADGQEVGNNFVGWSNTIPTVAGGNDSYLLRPVTISGATVEEIALDALIAEIEGLNITSGTNIGDYTTETVEALQEAMTAAKAVEEVKAEDVEALQNAYDALAIVLPATNKVYALDSYNDYLFQEITGSMDLKSTGTSKTDTRALWQFVAAEGGLKIQNVHTGLFIGANAKMKEEGEAVVFEITKTNVENNATTSAAEGKVFIKFPGETTSCLHSTAATVKPWDGAGAGNQYAFEEVSEFSHTVTVSDAEYATLMLGFNATIPADVEVYAVQSIEDGYVEMGVPITGVLPKNTAVILKNAGEYEFAYTTETANVTSKLVGTLYNKNITPEGIAYVLGRDSGVVGLYKAALTDGAFLNNANKAYLVVPTDEANAIASYSFNFDWGGTTGIENIEDAVEENARKAIYDITGRQIKAITAPGIYIINGKKTFVK